MAISPLTHKGPNQVPGFNFSAIHCGIKKSGTKSDLALIHCTTEKPAHCAGLFTTNRLKAAPVILGEKRIKKGLCRAIMINSGNANAATGKEGLADAIATSEWLAHELKAPVEEILVCSTGVIGQRLPLEKIQKAIPKLVAEAQENQLEATAKAICTTDTFPKTFGTEIELEGKKITLCGFAKGAGMIEPLMAPPHATMLAYLMCDANIDSSLLQEILNHAVSTTFNAMTVDGEMSTNDSVFLLANGQAQNRRIEPNSLEYEKLSNAVVQTCDFLARQIVRDGEGTSKFIELSVSGEKDPGRLRKYTLAIANSYLVRTAFYGQDANWGRILSAVGACAAKLGKEINLDQASIAFNNVWVVKDGKPQGAEAEKQAHQIMKEEEFSVQVILDPQFSQVTQKMYTSDLTEEYVRINADYRS